MNPALAGVALAVVVGAVIAGSARNARTAIFGLVITMVGVPLLADPVAAPLPLAARLVAAVLAGYLLWIATRGPRVRTGGSLRRLADRDVPRHRGGDRRLRQPRPRGAGGRSGAGRRGGLRPGRRSPSLPVVTGRDILRIGLGLGLLLGGALLVRTSLGGTPDPIEQLMTAGLVATLGGAVAILAIAARSDGGSGFELSATTPRRPGHVAEAHPADAHRLTPTPAEPG